METSQLRQIIKKKARAIFSITLAFLIMAALLTFSQPLKYRSQSRLLIIQNISADPYTVSRSNQYLSNLFSQIIYSSSFFDLALSNNRYTIDKNYFNGNYKKQMKLWEKTVAAQSVGDTGIIEIDVYHANPLQAKQLSLAVNDTLMTQSFNYQGNNQNQVKFEVIDQPIVSDYPVKPNVLTNLLGALILGFIFSLIYIYLFPENNPKTERKDPDLKQFLNQNNYPPRQPSSYPANLPVSGPPPKETSGQNYNNDETENNDSYEFTGNMNHILKR